MAALSRFRWPIRLATILTLMAVIPSLAFSASANALSSPQHESLVQMSSDPFTNSNSQHATEVEPDVYSYGQTVVATFQQGRFSTGGASDNGWATSHDGGKTWMHGSLPDLTIYSGGKAYHRASDPVVVYDAKHKTWIISSYIFDEIANPNAVAVSLSKDDGLTWSKPVIIVQNSTGIFFDKDWITCDNTPSSPYYGHCYDQWDTFINNKEYNLIQVSTSTDGGLTWSKPVTTADKANGTGGQPLVQPDGRVIIPILGETPKIYYVASFISINGGKSWSKLIKVSYQKVLPEEPRMRTNYGDPTAAIDSSGKVYLIWNDCRFEKGCTANDLVMTTSTDGISWTPVVRIPIDPIGSGVDHFNPAIAARTFNGSTHLALTYYYFPDTNCSVSTCKLDVGFISSTDGGKTWQNKEQLAGPMKLDWLAKTTRGYFAGDYIGTTILPDDDALPVIEVATPPGGGLLHEATYTTPEDALSLSGM
ncbi:MAG TPA: sialidase family protein [Ktedonobacteraceae bacterium]|jgi:hypothetical protein|nr:sialidase family protein [Ktedonobacteraceae bacterium]